MTFQIVFCDVDGTLLNSSHEMLPGTLRAIRALQKEGILFMIISGRGPMGIEPILKQYGFRCPMICYSGALMLDDTGCTVFSEGLARSTAARLIQWIEESSWDCVWNVYSQDRWIVKDRKEPRVVLEESIVHAAAEEGSLASLAPSAVISKIMCMCRTEDIGRIERDMKAAFPALSIARSSDTLLEIMQGGVSKSSAVKKACALYHAPLSAAIAFGDQFNDADMLKTVGLPFLMGNAPEELKLQFHQITDSNDEEGIYHAFTKLGLNMD